MPGPPRTVRIALLGLGEAGSEICRDLVAARARVRAYDPAVPSAPADARLVDRLIEGSLKHAERRSHEMAAACELLAALGVPSRVTAASHDWLAELRDLAC